MTSERLYKYYLLGLLLLIYAFNSVDGIALGLVQQNIKLDLHLSDTQLGFLTGIAFAFFYALMGIPLARWADRGNRVTIIGITTALWSVMVMLCGAAANFTQLLLIRVGVAVGESGCLPAGNSLLPDYFNRSERARASAIYIMGGSLGVFIAFCSAGWLNQFYGWRVTFVILGAPGIILSLLAALTLKEPRNAVAEKQEATPAEPHPGLIESLSTLYRNGTFRNLVLCFSVAAFFGFGTSQWIPTFFVRSYGMKTGELGTWLAFMAGLGGMLGIYLGGEAATRWAPHNEPLQLKGMAVIYFFFGFIYAAIFLSTNHYVGFGLMGMALVGGATVNGPLFGTIQTLVPDRMRALSVALIFMCSNLIGRGLGPLAVGALSDALRPHFGVESVRYALLVFCPGYTFCAWYFWRASRTVARDIEAVHARQAAMHDVTETAARTSPA